MRRFLPAVFGLLIAVSILLMMCAFQVRFTDTVVVTRLNRVKAVYGPKDAGLYGKLPWPIESVHRYDARLRSFDTEFRQLGTQDQKTLILTAYAAWRIADAAKFLNAFDQEDAAIPKIKSMLENSVSMVLRNHPLSELVNVDEKKMKFAEIEKEFHAGIRDQAMEKYGIEVAHVGIKRLGLPESVNKEVFNRMKEERQREIKKLEAEGMARTTQINEQAKQVQGKIHARTLAYAKSLESKAEAEAAKYYKIFAENQNLSDFLKKIESIRKILASGQSTIVLPAERVAPFDLLVDEPSASGAGTISDNREGLRSETDAGPQASGDGLVRVEATSNQ